MKTETYELATNDIPTTTSTAGMKIVSGTSPMKIVVESVPANPIFMSVPPTDQLNSLQQLAAAQCNLPAFTPQHGKQWFTEAEGILKAFFIFDLELQFCKIARAPDMTTKSNVLELVEIPLSSAAIASLY